MDALIIIIIIRCLTNYNFLFLAHFWKYQHWEWKCEFLISRHSTNTRRGKWYFKYDFFLEYLVFRQGMFTKKPFKQWWLSEILDRYHNVRYLTPKFCHLTLKWSWFTCLLLYISKPTCLVMFWKENVLLVKWGCLYLALIFLKVFDAYAQFEESMISAKMETTAEMGATEEGTFQQLWYSFYIAVICNGLRQS